MIQLSRPVDGVTLNMARATINLRDKLPVDFNTDNGLLIGIRSQFTNKIKYFVPVASWGISSLRVVQFFIFVSSTYDTLANGIIELGTKDYPLGFYDISIFQNSTTGNLDPSGLSLLYTGLANVKADDAAASPTYTEYTTNDSNTESVYLTLG